jgi:hypothetical protein
MLVRKALVSIERKKDYKRYVLDALHFTAASWNSVGSYTIVNCFRNAGFCDKKDDDQVPAVFEDEHFSEWNLLPEAEGIKFSEFVSADDSIITTEVRDIEDNIDDHQQMTDDAIGEDAVDEDEHASPTFAEAVEALDTVPKYLTTSETGDTMMNNFIQMQNYVVASAKQTNN